MKKYSIFIVPCIIMPLYGKKACKPKPVKKTEVKKEANHKEQKIVVTHGQRFDITLQSNPSTGYDWHFKEPLDAKHLQLIKETYKPARGKAGLAGAPGKKTFSLKAHGKGIIPFTLHYKRIWEDAAPAEEKEYVIEIK